MDWLRFETRPSSLLNFGMAYEVMGNKKKLCKSQTIKTVFTKENL